MGYGVVLESAVKLEVSNGKLLYWKDYAPKSVTVNVITRPREHLSKSVWFFINHIGRQQDLGHAGEAQISAAIVNVWKH